MIGRIVSIGIAVVFCLFSSFIGIAQQNRVVDSLFKQLASATDTTRVNILNKLSYKLYATDQDKSNELAHQALDLSRKLKYFPGIVYASNNIGINYEHGGKLDKALETYFFALKILEGTSEPSWEASLLSNIGVVYIHQANYKKAAEYLEKGVHILDSLGKKDDAAPKLINLGAVYGRLGRYDDAQNAYNIALERFIARNDKKNIAGCYSNMGILVQKKEGSGKNALPYYLKAEKLSQEINDAVGLLSNRLNIGVVYIENSEFEKAAFIFNECLAQARDMKYFSAVVTIYANLAELYARKNDYKTAYHFQELFFAANDSMISESSTMQMQELETKYQTAQKEKEIQVKELELQKSRNRIFVLTMVVVTVLFLSIIIYIYLRREKIVAKKLEKAKSVFFSNVAHDFRTPVALITGPIEQVLAESADWSLKQKLSMPLRNARYLLRLINQLLDVSKMEAGVLILNERLGDLSSFLFELTDQLQPMAVAKNISLTLDVPHLTVERYFDADVVEKIIYNLVSNAIKFTPEHGRVAVQLSTDGPDAKIVSISVRDNGIGISAKDQDRVFNRFFRSAVPESNSGVGLGLSIVKDLTALCGGTVTVSSVIGKGSEFIVALPLRQGIQNAVGQGVADTGDINGSQPIVLVIEDNHDMVEFVKSVLSESGYNVHVAVTGKEGVDKATEIIPDVVITDLMLPDIDGYEVCRTIKSQPATDHIPVIMLTARASAEKKLEGIESGADNYISKPFNPAELKGCISNLLAMRTRIREQYNQPQGEKEEPITDNYAGLRQSENVFVARVFALIDKNMSDEEFSVDTLAREMFLSRAQFHRKLKMLTGYAASDLIRRIRLEKALELLKNNAGSVTEIAFMTGFNSQPYFTKCFTQQYGYSPKEVKK